SFSLSGPSAPIPRLDPYRVPSLRWALPITHRRTLRDALDEAMERFDIGNVLPTKPGESRAEILIKPHAVRGERIPQLPRKPSAPDVPVGEDDRLAMVRRDQFAQSEDRRTLVDHSDVPRDPEGAQRAFVVLALDDDRSATVLLREVFEDALQVDVELFPVHRRRCKDARTIRVARREAIIYRPPDTRNRAGRGRGAKPARSGARPLRRNGRPPGEEPRGRVRRIAHRTGGTRYIAVHRTATRNPEETTRADESRSRGGHETSGGLGEPQGSRPRPRARRPAAIRGHRHDISIEK